MLWSNLPHRKSHSYCASIHHPCFCPRIVRHPGGTGSARFLLYKYLRLTVGNLWTKKSAILNNNRRLSGPRRTLEDRKTGTWFQEGHEGIAPQATPNLPDNNMTSPHPSARADGESILVVEDEPSIQKLIELVLQSSGYRVITASDGIQALELYAQNRHALSLVLTDLKLPRLSGLDLVRAIQTKDRHIPVIVASGSLDEWCSEELKSLEVAAFLNKPFTVAQLLGTVADVAGRRKAPTPAQ